MYDTFSSTSVYALGTGAAISLFTQGVVYAFQGKSRRREAADLAKIMFRYINMVLCLEWGQIDSILKTLDRYGADPRYAGAQKFIFTPLIVQVTDDHVQKLLACTGFSKLKESPEVIQAIVYAETSYQRCISIIERYNDTLEPERLSNADENVRSALLHSAASLLKGIRLAQEEAFKVNTDAREKIQSLGNSLFGKAFL